MSSNAPWERIFANDADGCATGGFVEGDRKVIVDAAKSGLPIRVAMHRAQGHPVFDCPVVWVRSDQVYAQSVAITGAAWGNTTSCDHAERALRFKANPNVARHIFSTNGERSSVGWNPRAQQWGSPRVTPTACEWFVPAAATVEEQPAPDPAHWELAYDTRRPDSTRLEALVDAVELGASVRVVIRQGSEAAARRTRRLHSFDASMVWVRMLPDAEPGGLRWKVFAQSDPKAALVNWDAEDELWRMREPAESHAVMVDTTGRYEVLIWREQDGATRNSGASTGRAISWYVRR